MLAGNGHELLLRFVVALALPVTRRPMREFRRESGERVVPTKYLGWRASGVHEIVNLTRGSRVPSGVVRRELDLAHGWCVPEHPVAAGRDDSGNRDLSVAVHEFDDASPEIEVRQRMLAESVKAFTVVRIECHGRFKKARCRTMKPAMWQQRWLARIKGRLRHKGLSPSEE